MPKDKDLKRAVRARMKKTGESYTTARAQLREKAKRGDADKLPSAVPKREWPALAGTSDETIREKTGKTWRQWVVALDAEDAYGLAHRDIAKLVASRWKVGGWWAQTITVGYERIRGLREVGQRRTGAKGTTFDASKSRTFPVPVGRLYRAFRDVRVRRGWLPVGVAEVRTAKPNQSLRITWADETRVDVYFTEKSADKSAVTIQHGKLPKKGDVARMKTFWEQRLNALSDCL